jgi:erythromycin esterase-like protein
VETIRDRFIPQLQSTVRLLEGAADDYDPLMDIIGDDVRFVLIGEASHGTHEFYHKRAQVTQRLIRERGFNAVVAEADWPDAYRVNRFVRGFNDDAEAVEALDGFKRFPQWMWRNAVVLDFVGWLREHNDAIGNDPSDPKKVGFYGMDLYSLHASIQAVLGFLDKVDHAAATRARYRYSCFDHFGEDPQAYGYAANFDLTRSCEDQAIDELVELRRKSADYARRDGRAAEDEFFYAEQNARVVANAEQYYRAMFRGRISSWNIRDQHMAQTLEELARFFDARVGRSKFVIWAHNSHIGDARATEMGDDGELNLGQLVRQRWGDASRLIGFSTYGGTVTAAGDWDGPAERMRVNPALPGSWEDVFHAVGLGEFYLPLREMRAGAREPLREPRLQRAIGVIYLPQTERISHYFHARLADQFDAMIHVDQTRALEPLERAAPVTAPREEEETYPTGV